MAARTPASFGFAKEDLSLWSRALFAMHGSHLVDGLGSRVIIEQLPGRLLKM